MDNRQKRSYGYVKKDTQFLEKKQPRYEHAGESEDRPAWRRISTILLKSLGVMLVFVLLFPLRLLRWGWKRYTQMGKSLWKLFWWSSIILGVVGFVMVTIIFAFGSRDLPDPNKLTDRQIAQSTKIYDRTGEHLLYEIYSDEKRTLVELEEIPDFVVQGVIATEDKVFYEHWGVRPLSIIRAFVMAPFRDWKVKGTSTLTQQLVKNAILTNERSVMRKVKEFILAIKLERAYTKDQILQIYFNEIPYGSTNYGIQSAAQSYFGKDVGDLTLSEGAALAGLPQAPTIFLNNPELFKQRRDFVLRRLFAEGYISEEEKNSAQAEELHVVQNVSNIHAPHFVLYVKEQLVQEYGEQQVGAGGLRVITTLDWNMQEKAEVAVAEESEKRFADANADNTSLVAMNPDNGHIMSLVGSRDFFDQDISGQFNVATQGRRQPGSSFKPIVYAAAFEIGYTPQTILFDVVTNFGVGARSYEPTNYDFKERGPVTIRQALQGSLNIPAVKALYLIGEKFGIEFAEKLGYTTLSDGDFGLSLVLGGGEVTLLEHVAAFCVFANGGERVAPVSILRVEDADGTVLQEWKESKKERVIQKNTAAMISDVLSDDASRAYLFGAGGVLTLPGRPVAVKTGTTNYYVDAWTVGYTPSLVAGVWVGNTDNTPMTRGYGGSRVAAPIWNNFMRNALEGTPVQSFDTMVMPNTQKPVLMGSEGGAITLRVNKVTGNIATSSTPEKYIVERTYTQAHSILHYITKSDPQGDLPENPEQDSQYQNWEAAIQSWIERRKEENPDWEISFEEPPAGVDDAYALSFIPTVEAVYPSPGSAIFSSVIDTDMRFTAPRGVAEVKYYIDERLVGTETAHPFNLHYEASTLSTGQHNLTVIIKDDVGNVLEEIIPFVFAPQDGEESALIWNFNAQSVEINHLPINVHASIYKPEEVNHVTVTAKKDDVEIELYDAENISQAISIAVSELEIGRWRLEGVLTTKNGSIVKDSMVLLVDPAKESDSEVE
ncbi:PBP1A family penicillin-binding protein [Patescibacteria group bacterium]|nr:PBP1A family penicillin-binding protein [Patescibacteria group bacterium]MBU1721293.1 PBP1A family penicillin-binding protein [Patescibacteria group bacterium]MBU1900999.1 PBP1A family penicillin-binding protein [Patescibacteria group bacterium]